jgi:2-polyprenyl-3-methyl-5-hydroxy-6-metoxy-1,4-benzoquinol methylase
VNQQELTEQVKRQMSGPKIHGSWESSYRTEETERFFEQAFDRCIALLNQPRGSRALDIGCGICANSMRLARRGYRVSAADYSDSILERAKVNVRGARLDEQIDIGHEDILNLSYPDRSFDLVLCWGVLMHIPEAEQAVRELIRVARPGGFIVLEEINMHAPEAVLMRTFWRLLKRRKIRISRAPAGFEHICSFADEVLFWRHADIPWLVKQFTTQSCDLIDRSCSLFSESYLHMPLLILKSSVHAWNRLWLRYMNLAQPSFHNVLVFRKT